MIADDVRHGQRSKRRRDVGTPSRTGYILGVDRHTAHGGQRAECAGVGTGAVEHDACVIGVADSGR